jgi:hypothetical protein
MIVRENIKQVSQQLSTQDQKGEKREAAFRWFEGSAIGLNPMALSMSLLIKKKERKKERKTERERDTV